MAEYLFCTTMPPFMTKLYRSGLKPRASELKEGECNGKLQMLLAAPPKTSKQLTFNLPATHKEDYRVTRLSRKGSFMTYSDVLLKNHSISEVSWAILAS